MRFGGAVILAAGRSTRFGSDKRLLPIGPLGDPETPPHPDVPIRPWFGRRGGAQPMYQRTVDIYNAVFPQIIFVLGPEDRGKGIGYWEGPITVYAEKAALGMGHSLAAGAKTAREIGCRYLFVALADMPWVSRSTLVQLQYEMAAPDSIVQPVYRGTPGHPVGFGSDYFDELEALQGDIGAKGVVDAHPDHVRRIPVDDPGTIQDIDVPADAKRPGPTPGD